MIAILTKKPWTICFVALAATGCSGHAPAAGAPETVAGPSATDASIPDAADGLSEAEARLLLDRLFRERGLRILNDVAWQSSAIEVTLDGYDPERAIGYEYVAASERGTELAPAEIEELKSHPQIFVTGPTSATELQQRVEDFLTGLVSRDVGAAPDR